MITSKSPPTNRPVSPSRRTTSRPLLILLATLALLLAFVTQVTLPQSDLHDFLDHPDPSVLILTAHPDDECMFFGPTVLALTEQGIRTSGLCLSQGNAEGLGDKRKTELVRSYAQLGVPSHRVLSLDEPELQDGMNNPWSAYSIASALRQYPNISSITTIITFDVKGITDHPNHTPLSAGVTLWQESRSQSKSRSADHDEGPSSSVPNDETRSDSVAEGTRLIVLKTYPKRIKFLGPLYPLGQKASWLLSHIYSSFSPFHIGSPSSADTPRDPARRMVITSSTGGYLKALDAMKEHESQLVWFRWLYVGASKYMWSNTLMMA